MSTLAEDLKRKGNDSFKRGLYQQAIEDYTESLKHDSENALVYSNRSLAYTKLLDFSLALSDAQSCIQRRPQWAKGYLRKAAALEGLEQHEEVMIASVAGFKLTSERKLKKDLVDIWFRANQKLNQLPEGSIELPRGIFILSNDYQLVLAYLMRSLSGEQPLTQTTTLQCLCNCAEQMEKLLVEFGESSSSVIQEWAENLAQEVYPYTISVESKDKLTDQMSKTTRAFITFIEKEVDPALYVLLRPILGLVVLVVLNRSNILCETNTGHHSSELMNIALLQIFELSILNTDEYYSMYIGRICAILDSFIG